MHYNYWHPIWEAIFQTSEAVNNAIRSKNCKCRLTHVLQYFYILKFWNIPCKQVLIYNIPAFRNQSRWYFFSPPFKVNNRSFLRLLFFAIINIHINILKNIPRLPLSISLKKYLKKISKYLDIWSKTSYNIGVKRQFVFLPFHSFLFSFSLLYIESPRDIPGAFT